MTKKSAPRIESQLLATSPSLEEAEKVIKRYYGGEEIKLLPGHRKGYWNIQDGVTGGLKSGTRVRLQRGRYRFETMPLY